MEMHDVLIMITSNGFYPIEPSGKKPIKDEARDHLFLNDHVIRIEDIDGRILADRKE